MLARMALVTTSGSVLRGLGTAVTTTCAHQLNVKLLAGASFSLSALPNGSDCLLQIAYNIKAAVNELCTHPWFQHNPCICPW